MATILIPPILEIGGYTLGRLPAVLASLGATAPMLFTDPGVIATGAVARVQESLAHPLPCHDSIVPDPTSDAVDAAVAALHAAGADAIIAIGGGSVLDTAKAAAVLAVHGGHCRDYKVPRLITERGLPVIAIPTTAGTGSEVTRVMVITDSQTDEKMLCGGPALMPAAAIVDYTLTLTCPRRLTADTAIDSLTHAIEAYVSAKANPFTDGIALQAMAAIARWLPVVDADPANVEGREALMLAATLGGIAFSNASVALVHGMSRPIGAFFHVPHGLSNAMLLPAVTAWSVSAAPSRYAAIARAVGATTTVADAAACSDLVRWLAKFNQQMAVPDMATWGIPADRFAALLPTMVEQALASGSPANNPRVPDAAEIITLYQRAYAAE
jgi:alcohol dehydrogenase class IV